MDGNSKVGECVSKDKTALLSSHISCATKTFIAVWHAHHFDRRIYTGEETCGGNNWSWDRSAIAPSVSVVFDGCELNVTVVLDSLHAFFL